MLSVKLISVLLIILFVGFLISQIIIPLVRGTIMFPLFFAKEGELLAEKAKQEQAILEAELAAKLQKPLVDKTEI